MKKTACFCFLLACLLLCSVMAGCNRRKDTSAEETAKTKESVSISVSGDYTITAPPGLDYDKVYVLYADAANESLLCFRSLGLSIRELYSLIYAKDGAAVAEYCYYVFEDESAARTFASSYNLERSGVVAIDSQSGDEMAESIASMKSSGLIQGTGAEEYVYAYMKQLGYSLLS